MNYLISKNEWLEMCQELNYSEIKILYYIRTSENNSIEIEQLSSELNLSKSTIYRVINSLLAKSLIEKTPRKIIVKILGGHDEIL